MSLFERRPKLVIGGGAFAGFMASICCVGPLVLTMMGVSGAALLSKFDFLRIPMTLSVFVIFGFAGWKIWESRNLCQPGSFCSDRQKRRFILISYWLGLCVAVLGVASPYWIAWIFG